MAITQTDLREGVADADAILKTRGLPTYSELVGHLRALRDDLADAVPSLENLAGLHADDKKRTVKRASLVLDQLPSAN